jgi:hypothetical protein
MAKKPVEVISRKEFFETAEPLEVIINGQSLHVEVKEFASGSFGWHLPTKLKLRVGKQPVRVQVGIVVTVVGSKNVKD